MVLNNVIKIKKSYPFSGYQISRGIEILNSFRNTRRSCSCASTVPKQILATPSSMWLLTHPQTLYRAHHDSCDSENASISVNKFNFIVRSLIFRNMWIYVLFPLKICKMHIANHWETYTRAAAPDASCRVCSISKGIVWCVCTAFPTKMTYCFVRYSKRY